MECGRFAILAFVVLAGCTGASNTSPPSGPSPVTLGWSPQYLGFASALCTVASECLRAPGANSGVPIAQNGNGSIFAVTSNDPQVATGAIVMSGPSGQGNPVVEAAPKAAGQAVLTIAGLGGAAAQLPVTVTTISTMTVHLNGLPNATSLHVTVSAPAAANCPSFEGGYSFDWDVSGATTVMQNFPAMGTGPLPGCVFSTVTFDVKDASYTTLATKTVSLAIAVGKDNPGSVTIP